jgi:hypothetical protein
MILSLFLIIAIQRYLLVCRPFGRQMTPPWRRNFVIISIALSFLLGFPAIVFYGPTKVSPIGFNVVICLPNGRHTNKYRCIAIINKTKADVNAVTWQASRKSLQNIGLVNVSCDTTLEKKFCDNFNCFVFSVGFPGDCILWSNKGNAHRIQRQCFFSNLDTFNWITSSIIFRKLFPLFVNFVHYHSVQYTNCDNTIMSNKKKAKESLKYHRFSLMFITITIVCIISFMPGLTSLFIYNAYKSQRSFS